MNEDCGEDVVEEGREKFQDDELDKQLEMIRLRVVSCEESWDCVKGGAVKGECGEICEVGGV